MQELIPIDYEGDNPTVSGRALHEALEVGTRYSDWFPRQCEFGFDEGKDYYSELSDRSDGLPGKPRTDHRMTLSMAKEVSMIQRTEMGKKIRQYLIQVEESWSTPGAVMARALKMADAQIKQLQVSNSALTVDNAIMKPKADYFDELVDRGCNTNFRDTAKELGIRQSDFVAFLLERKYLYRGDGGKLLPIAKHAADGLFVVKESFNEKTSWTGPQTLVTPKGKDHFRRLFPGA